VVHDLKVSANRFASQIPILEDNVKHLEDKVLEGLKEVRARNSAWSAPHTLMVTTKRKLPISQKSWRVSLLTELKHPLSLDFFLLFPLQLTESDAELNTLREMVNNALAFFYPGESSSIARAPLMLDSLSSRSREIILANIRQSMSLTLGILKSLYPRADLDVVGEGFVVTCSDEEALKQVEDSAKIVEQVVDMLGVDMSLG
jgi:hypothetical protein